MASGAPYPLGSGAPRKEPRDGQAVPGCRTLGKLRGQPRTTLPAFRQDVHTFMRLRCEIPIFACTVWMFGFHRRRVFRCECETELPNPGPLPQTSQTAATSDTPNFALMSSLAGAGDSSLRVQR
jgi:hypothetical protein